MAFAVAAAVLLDAQEPAPVFRAATELVTLDVTVLDDNRQPVRGLTAADFTIVDGDARLPVAALTEIDLAPVQVRALDAVSSAPTDVATNDVTSGRLIAILFDHTTTAGWPTQAARRIARSVLSQMGPADRAAVLFSHSIPGQSFTTDRARLLEAIDHPALGTSLVQPVFDPDYGDFAPNAEGGLCSCGVCTFDTITRVAQAVSDVPDRRKVLVFIGGFLPMTDASIDAKNPCRPYVVDAMRDMLQATQRANLTVYSFDPNGLEPPVGYAANQIDEGGFDAQSNALRKQTGSSQQGKIRSPMSLLAIADNTGGRAFLNTNEPEMRVVDVLTETGAYYVLGFEPRAGGRAGDFRSIRIDVNRRGVEVRARRGYYVPTPTASPTTLSSQARLQAALQNLLPAASFQLRLGTVPIARMEGKTAIGMVVSMEPPDIVAPRHVLAGVYDANGQQVGTARMRVDSTPRSIAEEPGVMDEIFMPLDVPSSGTYHVRVAVDDEGSGRVASVYDIVDVPDFERAGVSLSGLALAPEAASARSAARSDLLPVTPTLRRTFLWTDRVSGFVQVVQPVRRGSEPVSVTVRVFDDEGEARFELADRLEPDAFDAAGHAPYTFVLPIDALTAGNYRLIVEAERGGVRAMRSANFGIE